MDIKKLAIIGILCGCVAFMGYEMSWADADGDGELSIAVVNIRDVFQGSSANEAYKTDAMEQQQQIMSELETLSKQIDAEKAGLKTLKRESEDYEKAMQDLMMKQAELQAKEEFYKQKFQAKDRLFTEKLYKSALSAVETVAKEQGYDLVIEQDKPDLPSPNAQELMLTIRTNKILYSGGLDDITDKVIEKLDTEMK